LNTAVHPLRTPLARRPPGDGPRSYVRRRTSIAFSPVDPSNLKGEALSRWYLRSPHEIEQERQAAEAQRYDAFFAGNAPADSPTSSPATAYQGFSAATGDGPTWVANGTNRWRRQDQSANGPAADPQSGRFRLQVASQPAAAPGIVNCPTCHEQFPPLLPFPFPFLPGGPFFRDTPSTPSGGGSQPDRRDKKECDQQYDTDSQICGRLPSPSDVAICRETASRRYAHCLRPDGTIGFPHLETKGGSRP
jgi:hypothetical protein